MTQNVQFQRQSLGWGVGDRPYNHTTVRIDLARSAENISNNPSESLHRLQGLLEQEAQGRNLSLTSVLRFYRDTVDSYRSNNSDFLRRSQQSQINLSQIQSLIHNLSERSEYAEQLQPLLREFDRIQGFIEVEDTLRNGTAVLGTDTFQRLGVFVNMAASLAGHLGSLAGLCLGLRTHLGTSIVSALSNSTFQSGLQLTHAYGEGRDFSNSELAGEVGDAAFAALGCSLVSYGLGKIRGSSGYWKAALIIADVMTEFVISECSFTKRFLGLEVRGLRHGWEAYAYGVIANAVGEGLGDGGAHLASPLTNRISTHPRFSTLVSTEINIPNTPAIPHADLPRYAFVNSGFDQGPQDPILNMLQNNHDFPDRSVREFLKIENRVPLRAYAQGDSLLNESATSNQISWQNHQSVQEILSVVETQIRAKNPNWNGEFWESGIEENLQVHLPEDVYLKVLDDYHEQVDRFLKVNPQFIDCMLEIQELLEQEKELSSEQRDQLQYFKELCVEDMRLYRRKNDFLSWLLSMAGQEKTAQRVSHSALKIYRKIYELRVIVDSFLYARTDQETRQVLEVAKQGGSTDLSCALSSAVYAADLNISMLHLLDSVGLSSISFKKGSLPFRVLTDVLTNLLTNVGRYGAGSNAEIYNSWIEGEGLQISVSDQGIGMLSENLRRLGEHNFREGRAQIKGSHGHGLSSVIELLYEMGWSPLVVKSKVGQGSEFRFVIPAEQLLIHYCEAKNSNGLQDQATLFSLEAFLRRVRAEDFTIPDVVTNLWRLPS